MDQSVMVNFPGSIYFVGAYQQPRRCHVHLVSRLCSEITRIMERLTPIYYVLNVVSVRWRRLIRGRS
jgi:hypothetical protein